MMKRSVFQAVGGMDERFAADYNDVDLCMRICSLGLAVVVSPEVRLTHFESVCVVRALPQCGLSTPMRLACTRGRVDILWEALIPGTVSTSSGGTLYFTLDWNGNEAWPCIWTFTP